MLQLKMLTQVNGARTQILVKDNTGNYNATTNPGGWGGINYPKDTTNLTLFRYQVVGQTASAWLELTGQRQENLYTGLEVALVPQDFGVAAGLPFDNGEYIIEWMVLFDYVTPGTLTSKVLVDGTINTVALTLDGTSPIDDLREILQPRAAVYTPGTATSLNLIDMSQPYTETTASVEDPLVATLTNYALYSVGSVSAMIAIVDDVTKCVMDSIAGVAILNDCGCGGPEEDKVVFMTIMKFGMDINLACGNLQAAENLRKSLLSMCDCKCGC